MANLNPQNKFQKGDKRAGRKPGQPNLMTRDNAFRGGVVRQDHFAS
jgi:hypothetical protein